MFSELKARWLKKTGDPMPESILRLPLKKICKAVLLVEADVTVVVPPEIAEASRESDSSIRYWDGESNN